MLKTSAYNVTVPLNDGDYLIFNSISQKLALIDRDELRVIENPDPSKAPQGLIQRLQAENFVVAASQDERELVNGAFDRRRASKGAGTITIAPTLGCNLACTYCFQGQDKPSGRMTDAVCDALVAHAQRLLRTVSRLNVCWYGGEPLMNQDAIWTLSARLKAACQDAGKDYSASVVSSGYLMTEAVARRLVECGVTMAQVTLDGGEEDHDRMRPLVSGRGTHRRIIENLKQTVFNTELVHSIRINMDSSNVDAISGFLDHLANLGFGHRRNFKLYFAPIEAITAECRDADALTMAKVEYATAEVELLKKALDLGLTRVGNMPMHMSLCQAVRGDDIIVLPNGDLHKCWDTVQDSAKSVGTIFELNDGNALRDELWMAWDPTLSPVCQQCKILPICGGGCAFKTVYADEGTGEAGTLPCPSLKFNLAERIFLSAREAGVVTVDDWDADHSPTWTRHGTKTGGRHTAASVADFAERVRQVSIAPVDAIHDRSVDGRS